MITTRLHESTEKFFGAEKFQLYCTGMGAWEQYMCLYLLAIPKLKQNESNRPLHSREYKLMLVRSEFEDTKKGTDRIQEIIRSQLDSYSQSIKGIQEREFKRTWFLG